MYEGKGPNNVSPRTGQRSSPTAAQWARTHSADSMGTFAAVDGEKAGPGTEVVLLDEGRSRVDPNRSSAGLARVSGA